MDPGVTTSDPASPSIAPMPSSIAQQPARVTDPPVSPTKTATQGPAAGQAGKLIGEPPTQAGSGLVAPGPWYPSSPGDTIHPPEMKPSDPSLRQVLSGDPAASALGDPQQGGHLQGNELNLINEPAAAAPIANSPAAAKQGLSNPNDESAAQMSALHEALGPAPPISPQGQPTTNRPAADLRVSPPVQLNAAVASDSSDPHTENSDQSPQPNSNDPQRSGPSDRSPLPDEGTVPTMIRLGLQPAPKPITISLGNEIDRDPNNPGSGNSMNGDAVVAMTTIDGSGTKNSNTDAAIPMVTVAANILTAKNPSSVSIAGTVLTPGGAEATVAGKPVSLASGGNFVPGAGAASHQPAIFTAGGQTFIAHSTGFVVAGISVAAGGPAVLLAGTAFSLGKSGILVVGSSTTTLTGSSPPPIFIVGGQTFTANPTAIWIAGTALSAGGPVVLLSGTPISLGPSGDLAIGSITHSFPDQPHSSIFTVGGQTFTAVPTGFAIATTTIAAGGPGLTISGTPISLNPVGWLIVGTTALSLGDPTPSISTTDSQVLELEGGKLATVNGAILTHGEPAITFSGTPMRVHSNDAIIETSTIPSPAINGSFSTISDAINPNATSITSSLMPHTPGTGEPKVAAASYKTRAPSVIWWVFHIVAAAMFLG